MSHNVTGVCGQMLVRLVVSAGIVCGLYGCQGDAEQSAAKSAAKSNAATENADSTASDSAASDSATDTPSVKPGSAVNASATGAPTPLKPSAVRKPSQGPQPLLEGWPEPAAACTLRGGQD